MSEEVDSTSNDDTTKTISIQVPDTAEPGDTLTFVIEGDEMELVVPVGSRPGDVLELQVQVSEPPRKKGKTNDDTKVYRVAIDKTCSLEFVTSLPTGQGDTITKQETMESDGTFAMPWRSAMELASRWKDLLQDPTFQAQPIEHVMELGSGLGVVGLSWLAQAAKDCPTSLYLTDLPAAVPLLLHNVEQNQKYLPQNDKASIQALPLTWTLSSTDNERSSLPTTHVDCVLGSDLLYNTASIPALVATIERHLHPTHGYIWLAVRWRKPDLERAFFEETTQACNIQWELKWPPPTTTKSTNHGGFCSLSWKDFGNPNVQASNQYFHQTQISVNGSLKSLFEITEEDTKHCSDSEFEAWERAHIQIYYGRRQAKKKSNS